VLEVARQDRLGKLFRLDDWAINRVLAKNKTGESDDLFTNKSIIAVAPTHQVPVVVVLVGHPAQQTCSSNANNWCVLVELVQEGRDGLVVAVVRRRYRRHYRGVQKIKLIASLTETPYTLWFAQQLGLCHAPCPCARRARTRHRRHPSCTPSVAHRKKNRSVVCWHAQAPPKKKKAHTSSLAGSSTRRRLTGIVAAAAAIVPGEFATAAMEPSNAPSNIINMSLTGMPPGSSRERTYEKQEQWFALAAHVDWPYFCCSEVSYPATCQATPRNAC